MFISATNIYAFLRFDIDYLHVVGCRQNPRLLLVVFSGLSGPSYSK